MQVDQRKRNSSKYQRRQRSRVTLQDSIEEPPKDKFFRKRCDDYCQQNDWNSPGRVRNALKQLHNRLGILSRINMHKARNHRAARENKWERGNKQPKSQKKDFNKTQAIEPEQVTRMHSTDQKRNK